MKRAYIGIDAHKEQNLIALAFAGRGDPELYGKAPADLDAFVRVLRRVLEKYGLEKEDVAICYEAGPTGFVLCRRLRVLGFECEVVAPSLIPVKASDRVKTDRRDARKLAGLFRAGELTFVNVPDVADEVIRDVCRGRTDAAEVRGRARQHGSGDPTPCGGTLHPLVRHLFVMGPHPNDFHSLDVAENLIDQPVLDIDATRAGAR